MMDGGWSKYSNTAGSYSISWTAASSTRWLSNWMVTPIFLLGYRPLTFDRPPPTWREGPDDRMQSMIERVCAGMASRWNHNNRSSLVSTVATCAAAYKAEFHFCFAAINKCTWRPYSAPLSHRGLASLSLFRAYT